MPILHALDAKLLFSKGDPLDRRLGDTTKLSPSAETLDDLQATLEEIAISSETPGLSPSTFIVLGYPDDEGITLNGGRSGAREAPDRIRAFLYRMTPPAFLSEELQPSVYDFGNLSPNVGDISKRHELVRAIATSAYANGLHVLSFGGGHDYGFPDASAYCQWALARGERPLVINFDAHVDVRPLNRGLTSGTPFFRLLEEFPDIDFVELGLQSQCNSKAHVDWLVSRGGLLSFEDERRAAGDSLTETLAKILGDKALSRRSAFLSVDIDGFTSTAAPGASQSWPTGFEPADFFACFSWCLKRFDVRGTGVYEVSPPLDVDDQTSRLAALIAHRFVFQL